MVWERGRPARILCTGVAGARDLMVARRASTVAARFPNHTHLREFPTMLKPTIVADHLCECGEGPLWHPDEKVVYWVDIPKGRLFRYNPADGSHEQLLEGPAIGGYTIQDDGALLLFMAQGAIREWRDGVLTTLLESIPGEEGSRFNDVIADPEGRVYCGTMRQGDSPGRLYRLDTDGTLTMIEEGIGCSNGMGFTPDRTGFYHSDSPAHLINLYDYDQTTGGLANKRIFVETPDDSGVPDGMTVDARGCVWSAKWDGWCLERYNTDGTLMQRLPMPAKKTSCITFGGDDYTDIYLTAARGGDKENEGPAAGSLMRMDLGIQGAPEFRSRIHGSCRLA
jgi:D-xylonolactonase